MAVTHELKCDPPAFDAVERNEKNFEVRRDDRGFQKGDTVVLKSFDRAKQSYVRDSWGNTKSVTRKIKYILTGGQYGVEPGYVVLALR